MIVIKNDLSGFVVAVHSGLREEDVQSIRLKAPGLDLQSSNTHK